MKKWYIVHNDNAAAVKSVFAAVSQYTVASCIHEDDLTDEIKKDGCLIYTGVKGIIDVPKDGYRIKVSKNENGSEIIVLDGDGYVNELYAAVDFENKYLVKAMDANKHDIPYFFNDIFNTYDMPDYDESFNPYIKERALWSWGYVIYNYKGYVDNMLKLKLNELVIWSDYPPENADEVVRYAHKKGVKIIWGFAWGWSTDCLDTDISNLDKMADESAAKYENDYAHLDGDEYIFRPLPKQKRQR